MTKKRRSQAWYGKSDRDGFIHRSWMKNQGFPDHAFDGRPIIGICNGFQALVKAGLLPGHLEPRDDLATSRRSVIGSSKPTEVAATLTDNENGRFECRWVHLAPGAPHSVWMSELTEPIRCPVAHGEGRFVTRDDATLAAVEAANLVALRYVTTTPVGQK